MLLLRADADPAPRPLTVAPALLTRDECAIWQLHAERIARRRGHPGRMLELALAALQYAADGATPEEALHLADEILFGERGVSLKEGP